MAMSVVDTDTNCYGPTCRCGGTLGDDFFIMFLNDNAQVAQFDSVGQTITAEDSPVDVIPVSDLESGGPSNVSGTDYAIIIYKTTRGVLVGGTINARIIEAYDSGGGTYTIDAHTIDSADFDFYSGGGQTQWASTLGCFVQMLSTTTALAVWNFYSQVPTKYYSMYAVIDVSGTSVTVNTPDFVNDPANDVGDLNASWYRALSLTRLSDSTALLLYRNDLRAVGSFDSIYAVVVTVSGTTISLGTPTLLEQNQVNPATTNAVSCNQAATIHPYDGRVLLSYAHGAGFGQTYLQGYDSAFGVRTAVADYQRPCAGAPMSQDQFLWSGYEDQTTNNPYLTIATLENDLSVTVEADDVELTTGTSTYVTDVYIPQDGVAIAFGSTDAWVISGAEILLAEAPPVVSSNRLWVYKSTDNGISWENKQVRTP